MSTAGRGPTGGQDLHDHPSAAHETESWRLQVEGFVAIEVGSRSFWLAAAATVGAVGLNSVDDLLLSHPPIVAHRCAERSAGDPDSAVSRSSSPVNPIAPIGWRHG